MRKMKLLIKLKNGTRMDIMGSHRIKRLVEFIAKQKAHRWAVFNLTFCKIQYILKQDKL